MTLEGKDKTLDIIHKPSVFWSTAPTNPPIGVGEANRVRLAAAGEKVYLHVAYGGTPGTAGPT